MSIFLTKDSKVIVQGMTGSEGTKHTTRMLASGTNIVGGVNPRKAGQSQDFDGKSVPVFGTVADAVKETGANVSVIFVPPKFTKDAVLEAIDAGVGLIVIVTERIPRGDVAQMVEAADARGARIIGPNCLGLVVPGVAKMGGIGGPAKNTEQAYQPGSVGVMSRSGGMTTEISSTLTAAGLGVSTAVSIGGDAIIGSTYAELMPLFEADTQTEAIVIYTEPGGRMEAQLADWVAENNSRLPIVAFMAGRFMDDEEMKGMSFGHAGTIVEGKEDTATEKIARLQDAGIPVVERIDAIPDAVREKLGAPA
jgi:succinyl-CoA synthetase alpha subunit